MSAMQKIQFPSDPGGKPTEAERFAKVDEYIAAREFSLALPLVLKMLEIKSDCIETLDRATIIYFELGDTATAIALLQFITANWPKIAVYWVKMAEMQQFTGDMAGAIVNFRKALDVDPNHVLALFKLNQLQPFKRDSKLVARLRKLDKSGRLTSRGQGLVSTTLGQVEATAGRHQAAFRHFSRSKAAKIRKFDYERLKTNVDDQIVEFCPNGDEVVPEGLPRVIFVCGLPRSGTTLVENILKCHDQVATVGESYALSQTTALIARRLAPGQNRWQWLASRSEEEIEILRNFYLSTAFKGIPNEHGVVVDKMPMNCLDIGVAQLLLPDARFVFMIRHPLDVGLSNYFTNFHEGNEFSGRLPWIGQATREVYRAAGDYNDKLGEQMRMQSFRALVQQPEEQIRLLLEQVGLPWQDACLHPELGKGTVRTASTLQVRKEINTKGLGKWKTYEKQLQPLIDALGGQDWLEQWHSLDEAAAGH